VVSLLCDWVVNFSVFSTYAPTDNQRRIPLPSACYEKLIFGKNMPEPIMEQLLISIPNDLGHLILIDE